MRLFGIIFDFLLDVFRLEKGFEKRLEIKSQCPEKRVRPTGGLRPVDRWASYRRPEKAVRSTGAPVRPTGGSSCFI